MLILLAALGCKSGEVDDSGEAEPLVAVHQARSELLPVAGWDPIRVDATLRTWGDTGGFIDTDVDLARPTITDADGAEVPVELRTWQDQEVGWVGEDWLAPGDYLITELEGVALEELIPFTVEDHGQAPVTFEGGAIYELERPWGPMGLAGSLEDYGRLWLEAREVGEDDVSLRLIAEVNQRCLVFQDRAPVDENGYLDWSLDEISANPEGDPFEMKDLSLRGGLASDGLSLAGVEAEGWVDARGIDAALGSESDPEPTCELLEAFGIHCQPCDDGEERCFPLALMATTFTRSDETIKQELPLCGVDLESGDLPRIELPDCECGTGGAPAGGSLGLLALVVGALRRRS